MNKIIIILVIFVMLFSGFTLLENSQTNNFYENKINTNNFISSNSPIYNLTIYIHNSPAGNGYYQQLFNFNSTSYFINNLNQNASNFYISYENGTLIYSWIQNWNFTTKNLSVWSKLQNGTKVIMIEIFNQNTNLLSANGFIGLAPQYSSTYGAVDNGKMVFPFYEDFKSGILKNFSTNYAQYLTFNDGLKILDGNSSLTVLSNISQGNSGTVLWNGEFNTGTSSNSVSQGTGTTGSLYLGVQFIGNSVFAFNYYNGSTAPENIIFQNTGQTGSDNNFSTNTFQNYAVSVNTTKGNTYQMAYLNNILQDTEWKDGYTSTGVFGFFTQQTSVAYEIWHYMAEINMPMKSMPTYTTSSTPIMFTYHIQIKSFSNQNSIKNCFKYNNNVYNSLVNTISFTNSSKFTFSLYPQNYTIFNTSYLTNTTVIHIQENQYSSANFINYYYNISISYYSKTSTPINYYSPPNYYFTIGIIIFLLIGGLIIYTKIRNGD